jgi:hypothetical protein
MKIHFKLIGSVFSSLRGRLLVQHSDDSSSMTLYGVLVQKVYEGVRNQKRWITMIYNQLPVKTNFFKMLFAVLREAYFRQFA